MADENQKVPVEDTPQPAPPKTVWIRCRAKEHCEGNHAVIVFEKAQQPTRVNTGLVGGAFTVAERVGKLIHYRCTTCNGVFHIGQ